MQPAVDEALHLVAARVAHPGERLADRLQLAREVAHPERLLHSLRVLPFLEAPFDAADARLLRRLAEQALEASRILLQERPCQLRELDPLLAEQLLQLVEEPLELGGRHLQRLHRCRLAALHDLADAREVEVEERVVGR